jgi:hypothetical protein
VEHANWRFGGEVVGLMRGGHARHTLAVNARKNARQRCDAERCIARYYEAFEQAREHCTATRGHVPRHAQLRPLLRWASVHSALLALGLVRPPTEVNRLGRKQPGWGVA